MARKQGEWLGLPNNPRKINAFQDEKLREGMSEYADISSIVIDEETGLEVHGNQRSRHIDINNGERARVEWFVEYDEPDEAGTVKLGVVHWRPEPGAGERPFFIRMVRWDAKKRSAAAILANKAGGDWDKGKLKLWGSENLLAGGFSEKEVEALGLGVKGEGGEEPPGKIIVEHIDLVKSGDIIELKSGTGLVHRIACGDSLDQELVGLLLGGEIPALCTTDPPYGVDYDPSWRQIQGGISATDAIVNDDTKGWHNALALFPGDVIYLWSSSKYLSNSLEMVDYMGFELAYEIIWRKPNFALGRGDYHYQHEPCLYAVRKGAPHNWQGSRKESSVWDMPTNMVSCPSIRKESGGHGTPKPVEAMARPMRNNSGENDSVYDPFMGSGTTLIAAEKVGRNSFGVEIVPYNVEVHIARWLRYIEIEGRLKGAVVKRNGEPIDPEIIGKLRRTLD